MKFFGIIFATGISFLTLIVLDSIESQIKSHASFDDFLADLKATAGSMIDYVTKIQALFCPDQPICGIAGELARGDVLGTLPAVLTVDDMSVILEDIHKFVGICCLPCSCSDSCWQDNNCCPTKQLLSNNSNSSIVRRECTAATIRSYNALPSLSVYHTDHMYLMITDCFHNKTNDTLLENCRNPISGSDNNLVPVTSLATGNIYWNRACAICNNDDNDVIEWYSNVILDQYFLYFSNLPALTFPDTLEKLFALLRKPRYSDIIFTTPVAMNNSTCIIKDALTQFKCEDSSDEMDDWVYESCSRFYSPVQYFQTLLGKTNRNVHRNIFCFICDYAIPLSDQIQYCNQRNFDRTSSGHITALMDFKRKSDEEYNGDRLHESRCGCNAVFDPHQNFCRPSYCPAGEYQVGCECIQVLRNLSGMQILLRVNVTAKSDESKPLNEKQLNKLIKTLSEALQAIVAGISVETAQVFQQTNATILNYIFVVITHSEPGHDTKSTMKPFMNFFDSYNVIEIKIANFEFWVRITSKIMLWGYWDESKIDFIYRVHDMLQPKNHFEQVYSNAAMDLTRTLRPGNYQLLSRLLYCTQLQINKSEYFETSSGLIIVNVTFPTISISDYYKITSSEVCICADEYLNTSKSNQETSGEAERTISHGFCILWFAILILNSDV